MHPAKLIRAGELWLNFIKTAAAADNNDDDDNVYY